MIPKQAKKREPDELVLATFRIPYEKWEKFQHAASAAGTTASATLLTFIESYLGEAQTGSNPQIINAPALPLESDLVEIADAKIAPELETSHVSQLNAPLTGDIEQRIEEIINLKITQFEPTINAIQTQVNTLSKRLDQVQHQVGQLSKGKTGKTSDFIDVEAVSVESDLNQDHLKTDRELSQDYDPEKLGGLSQLSLCAEFGINPNNVNRHASRRGLSTAEYLHQLTGWVYRQGQYYPPEG